MSLKRGEPMEPLLTVKEVSDLLRVTERTVRRWCTDGTIRAIHPGRAWRIPREALEELQHRAPIVETPGHEPDPAEAEPYDLVADLKALGFMPKAAGHEPEGEKRP